MAKELTYKTFWEAIISFEKARKKETPFLFLSGYRSFGRLEIGWDFAQFIFGFNYYPIRPNIFIGFFRLSVLDKKGSQPETKKESR